MCLLSVFVFEFPYLSHDIWPHNTTLALASLTTKQTTFLPGVSRARKTRNYSLIKTKLLWKLYTPQYEALPPEITTTCVCLENN